MSSGLPVAFALSLTFACCSVYEPSLLTGDGIEGSPASARGGNSGKAGAGGAGMGGTFASGNGGAGGNRPVGGSSALAGASQAGDAGGTGEAGDGAGGEADGAGGAGDGGSGASGGRGGTSGGTSGGGAGDAAGAGVSGGVGGVSGSGAGAGAGGGSGAGAGGSMGEACSGCARLSVPLAGPTDQAHFLMTLPENTDFTGAVLTFRVLCQAGTGGQLRGYLQHGGSPDFAFLVLGITELADLSGWTSVSYELSGVTGFDKTVVRRVGLEITAAGSSSWLNPTVVYLDSISIANTALDPSSFGFDDAASIDTTPSSAGPADQRLWWNDAPNDSNVAAALSWLGP